MDERLRRHLLDYETGLALAQASPHIEGAFLALADRIDNEVFDILRGGGDGGPFTDAIARDACICKFVLHELATGIRNAVKKGERAGSQIKPMMDGE